MATADNIHERFGAAVSYALSCLSRGSLKLKAKQEEVIRAVYSGKDVFVWLPTGYGKSICYQVLPFLFDYKLGKTTSPPNEQSVVVIVSPLVSLMIDQVTSLKTSGVSAAILSGNSGINKKLLACEKDIQNGRFRFLFTSPEAVNGFCRWKELMSAPPLLNQIVTLVVDEAHCVYKWSADFRPSFSRIYELRAFIRPSTPLLAATATVTREMKDDIINRLDMLSCDFVFASPNKPNIMYYVRPRMSIEDDLGHIIEDLRLNGIKANRVIIYCRSLNMCSTLYSHFLYELKEKSYYPSGAEEVSVNRLFGMFHSNTSDRNKSVILDSMVKVDGTVRVVFATTALGMGVNFIGLNTTIHYGAPRSVDDYFQESGRAGRSGELATSTIYWAPVDVPKKKDQAELSVIRRYCENLTECRRYFLLSYFDIKIAKNLPTRNRLTCCDNCKNVRMDTQ